MKLFFDSLKNYIKKLDWILLILSVILSTCGLILIYSATRSYNTDKFMIVQSASLVLGIIIFFIVGTFNFEQISRFWL
ncbi:MAG: cell division protein FtsW, partial [Clostridia bacterium]|nr:cell division protein FtsW [Clostridia bacterium]